MATFYHAGPIGLREILSPSITGAPSTAAYGAAGICRRDRVYVTTDLACAVGFASLVPPHGAGAVYEVEPVNPVSDPDCHMPGLSFEAESARIIRRVSVPGKALKQARKIMRAV
jgi:rifampin ADP-ribosylating transferase